MENKTSFCWLMLLFLITSSAWASEFRAPCEEDHSPCSCIKSSVDGSLQISCFDVFLEDVQSALSKTTTDDLQEFSWIIPYKEMDNGTHIPENLLTGNKTAKIITMYCKSKEVTIDPDAFRASSTVMEEFQIGNCRFTQQTDYEFLSNFTNLNDLQINYVQNVPSFQKLPPFLPSLRRIVYQYTTGMEELSELTTRLFYPNLRGLYIGDNYLTDRAVDQILNSILPASADSLVEIDIGFNLLKRFPDQIPHLFSQLNFVSAQNNGITLLTTDAFSFSPSVHVNRIYLNNIGLETIEPESFHGNFTGSWIDISKNNLTKFEESVFKEVLEQMSEDIWNGIIIHTNPFDCSGCELSWLIRDNRNLLQFANGGQCSNYTLFEYLNPNGFNDCP